MKPSRAAKLSELLASEDLRFLVEAHSGISARLAEEAGFEGLWGSGLTFSASSCVRDNNELSYTQVLDIVEYIGDACSIPLLLDGDTGYGNFNTMRRLVKKLEARQVAGVCIEDKLFPKTNSLIAGGSQQLLDIDEFAGKIKAGKDAQADDDFSIVARVEALIAGKGMPEALARADAYHRAGADAILIHSAHSSASEVLAFKSEWGGRCPVLIVPTKYYATPTEVFREAGFSVVIWANHVLRASVAAMQQTLGRLHAEQSLVKIEDRIAPLAEIFRLQRVDELEQAEQRYLPSRRQDTQALILAASRGKDLGKLTADRPKALVRIAGKPLLDLTLESLRAIGIDHAHVVGGYHYEQLARSGVTVVENSDYADSKEVQSLALGLESVEGPTLVAYGDVICHKFVLMQLLESEADITLAVDPDWASSRTAARYRDLVTCDVAYERHAFERPATLLEMGALSHCSEHECHGEWIGVMRLSAQGVSLLREALAEIDPATRKSLRMADLFNRMHTSGKKIDVIYVRGSWFDVDTVDDVLAAGDFRGDG